MDEECFLNGSRDWGGSGLHGCFTRKKTSNNCGSSTLDITLLPLRHRLAVASWKFHTFIRLLDAFTYYHRCLNDLFWATYLESILVSLVLNVLAMLYGSGRSNPASGILVVVQRILSRSRTPQRQDDVMDPAISL